jgi:hypothetical protein
MILFGLALRVRWPQRMKRYLLMMDLQAFIRSARSQDIYERSAALFAQARIVSLLARMTPSIHSVQEAQLLLNQARDWFVLLDDVTGLENVRQFQLALEGNGRDPWLDLPS